MAELLALDLSTSSTGWARFNIETGQLIAFGIVKPRVKGAAALSYPKGPLRKMQDLAIQLRQLIDAHPQITVIAIEEINRGIGRLPQKVLDGFHFILLDRLEDKINLVRFRDSDGRDGWRTQLGLRLSEEDKRLNVERKRINKRIPRGVKKAPIITKKHLACRFVNKQYGMGLDVDSKATDADIADAIGLGHCVLARL